MDIQNKLVELISLALIDIEKNVPLSIIVRKAIRIAELRNDFDNIYWLKFEMESINNKSALKAIQDEIKPHYSKEDFQSLIKREAIAYAEKRRSIKFDKSGKIIHGEHDCIGLSINEMEKEIDFLKESANDSITPNGLHPIDKYHMENKNVFERALLKAMSLDKEQILSRIRQRVFIYLSNTEKELLYGKVNSDVFEKYRSYVDGHLNKIAPEVLDKFLIAYKRLSEDNQESRSHALTSCRRILKAFSDYIYPPNNNLIKCKNGQERKFTEDKFISRLWQFASERVGNTSSGKEILMRIKDFGNRLDKIYELTCKGVHDNVSHSEVYQCVIQTYLIIGDLLLIYNKDSDFETDFKVGY